MVNKIQDNSIIKILGNAINKINYIINENKKNLELIRNDINKVYHKLNNLNINTRNNQEIKYNNGSRYVGEVVNGLAEGKGIYYWPDGNRYEGDWRNDKREGKGIFYYNNGDRSMGDYLNDKAIGKHAVLTKNGEVKTSYY